MVSAATEIIRKALHEFTDAAPHPEIVQKIRQCALAVDGVMDTHDLKVRTSGGLYQMEIHIVVDGQLTVVKGHQIAKAVEHCVVEDVGNFDRVIVHVDPSVEKKDQEL